MEWQLFKIILGVVLTNLVAGIINIVGTICPYLASYFNSFDKTIFSDQVLTIIVIAYFSESVTFIVMAYLAQRFQEIDLIIFSVVFCSTLLGLCSYITSPSLFFLLYGFSLGTLSTFLFYLPVWIAWKTVPENRKGLIAGLSGSSYIITPFVFGLIFTFIVNPDNLSLISSDNVEDLFGVEVYSRVPNALFWLAVCIFALACISILLIYKRFPRATSKSSNSSLTLKALLKHSSFWYLFSLLFFKVFYFVFILNIYKILGLAYIRNDFKISLISTIGFTLSAIFKISSGILLDNYSWDKLNIFYVIFEFLLCALFPLAFDNFLLFAIFFSLSVALSSCNYTTVWILITKIYPEDNWVLSVINLSMQLIMPAIQLLLAYIFPVTPKQLLGFTGIFLLTSLSHIATLILLLNKNRLCKPYKPSPLLS